MPMDRATDERAPLLAPVAPAPIPEPGVETSQESVEEEVTGVVPDDDTPLPRLQIFLLCYCRVLEPIAFFSIFPYINAMIEKTGGVNKEDVGFYSGLIESLFSLTQMSVMLLWGQAADRYGRKPVLVFSLFGVTCMTALFGLSQSLWQMILFRCMAGVFAGTVVTVRAMFSENSTKKTQATAFSYFSIAGNLGIFIGPLMGGLLESPADKFGSTFGRIRFFHDYPYALPGFASACLGLSAAILTALFVKETLHVHNGNKKSDEPRMSMWELLKYPGIRQVIFIFAYIGVLAYAFTAAYPVWLYEPVELGGLGFSPSLISYAIGVGGLSQALWLLIVFPSLHARVGTGGVLRVCAYAWPISFTISPLCNLLLRNNLTTVFWIAMPMEVVIGCGVSMAFSAIQLAVNDSAPSHETFGTLNGIILAVQSGNRAITPTVATSIYATGVKWGAIGGQLFWVVIVIVAMGLRLALNYLPARAEGKPQREGVDEA